MKKLLYLFISSLVVLIFSSSAFSQQKELDKLKGYISKGKMDKAQAYCDKVTSGLSEKRAARFYGYLALGYYNDKDFERAAESVLQSEDKKLAEKLAKEFDGKDNVLAAKLYIKAEKPEKGAELLFNEGEYEQAAKVSNSAKANMKYGDILFEKGKTEEALLFYTKAKVKGAKFENEKVLNHYYQKKDYKTAYKIQDYKEGGFSLHIQGSVFDKMVEQNESLEFMKKFMSDLNIYGNKQDEVIVASYANNKMLDKAEEYCMALQQPQQKITLTFLAEKATNSSPGLSAWANYKLGKGLLARDLLTTFLIEEAIKNNDKWEAGPYDKKLLADFKNSVKPQVEKCEKDYCELLKHAKNVSFNKANELIKENEGSGEEYSKASTLLKQAEIECK